MFDKYFDWVVFIFTLPWARRAMNVVEENLSYKPAPEMFYRHLFGISHLKTFKSNRYCSPLKQRDKTAVATLPLFQNQVKNFSCLLQEKILISKTDQGWVKFGEAEEEERLSTFMSKISRGKNEMKYLLRYQYQYHQYPNWMD